MVRTSSSHHNHTRQSPETLFWCSGPESTMRRLWIPGLRVSLGGGGPASRRSTFIFPSPSENETMDAYLPNRPKAHCRLLLVLRCPCATPVTFLRRLLRKLDRPLTAPRPPELDPSDSSSRPTVLLLVNESEIVRRIIPSEDRLRLTRLVSAAGWAASGMRAVGESAGATGPSGRGRRMERTRAVSGRYVVLPVLLIKPWLYVLTLSLFFLPGVRWPRALTEESEFPSRGAHERPTARATIGRGRRRVRRTTRTGARGTGGLEVRHSWLFALAIAHLEADPRPFRSCQPPTSRRNLRCQPLARTPPPQPRPRTEKAAALLPDAQLGTLLPPAPLSTTESGEIVATGVATTRTTTTRRLRGCEPSLLETPSRRAAVARAGRGPMTRTGGSSATWVVEGGRRSLRLRLTCGMERTPSCGSSGR